MRKISLTINGKTIPVSLALTPTEKKMGFNGSTETPNTGILFDFTTENAAPPMTMEEMTYPLDIIFLKGDKVVDFKTAQPRELSVTSTQKYDRVLETPVNTFLHKYLKGATVKHEPYEAKIVPKFSKGGVLKAEADYVVKVDDVPLDPSAVQILDTNGEVVVNLKHGARIFSRPHTIALVDAVRDNDDEKLVDTFLQALKQQDTQEQQYTEE